MHENCNHWLFAGRLNELVTFTMKLNGNNQEVLNLDASMSENYVFRRLE